MPSKQRKLKVARKDVVEAKPRSDSSRPAKRFRWKPVDAEFVSTGDACFYGLEEIEEIEDTPLPTETAEGTEDAPLTSEEVVDVSFNDLTEETTYTPVDSFSAPTKVKPLRFQKLEDAPAELSWSAFNLHPKLVAALPFPSPTSIQAATIEHALKYRDVVGCAQTGSGKTLAYGVPILDLLARHADLKSKKEMSAEVYSEMLEEGHENADGEAVANAEATQLTALILAPTRELALQVTTHLKDASKGIIARIVPIVGGMSQQKQKRQISSNPDVVVATPGRLWELLSTDSAFLDRVRCVKVLVVDEADRMLEAGIPILTRPFQAAGQYSGIDSSFTGTDSNYKASDVRVLCDNG
jgi:DEAD/DEAH box helicase